MNKAAFLGLLLPLAACSSHPATSHLASAAPVTAAPITQTAATTPAATTTASPSTQTALTPTATEATTAVAPTNEPSAVTTKAPLPTAQTVRTPAGKARTVAAERSHDNLASSQPVSVKAPTGTTASSDATQPTSSITLHPLKQAHHLEPFKATFRIYVSKIPLPITAELELSPQSQPDTWKMRFEVDSFLLHNLEESTFVWNDCRPRSMHYLHDFKGFGRHQFHDTTFDWNPPHVVNHSDTDDKSFTIPADSVDDLTVLLQAACFFGEGNNDYYATSIYGDEIRHNHFVLLRHEMLNTPLGKMDTLVIEKERKKDNGRHTLFWIAPSLNYMLVKAKHIENPALFGEVIMKSYEGPHAPSGK